MKRYAGAVIIVVVIILFSNSIKAQQIDFITDLNIINKKLSEKLPDPYKRPYIYKDEPSLIKKINPVNIMFGGTLYVYQNLISKQISSGCLYTPSCSEFSKNAVREYGLMKGVILSADRVYRCNGYAARDLGDKRRDPKTNRYPDPVSRYSKVRRTDGN